MVVLNDTDNGICLTCNEHCCCYCSFTSEREKELQAKNTVLEDHVKELQERQEGNNSQLQKREKVFGEEKEYLSSEISTLTAMLNCSKGKSRFLLFIFLK